MFSTGCAKTNWPTVIEPGLSESCSKLAWLLRWANFNSPVTFRLCVSTPRTTVPVPAPPRLKSSASTLPSTMRSTLPLPSADRLIVFASKLLAADNDPDSTSLLMVRLESSIWPVLCVILAAAPLPPTTSTSGSPNKLPFKVSSAVSPSASPPSMTIVCWAT